MQSKGPDSVAFTWVKGHATDAHVAQGIATQVNKEGNDQADEIADIGVAMHGEGTIHLAKTYNDRHKQYCDFMVQVVSHIVEAYLIHRELVRIEEAKAGIALAEKLRMWIFSPLEYVSQQTVRPIQWTSCISFHRKVVQQSACVESIDRFLRELHVCEVAKCSRGITWLELYILFRITGNGKPLDETPISPGDKSKQAIPLDKQLGHFKKQARRIVERTLAGGSDEHLFKPTHVLEANLQCVGIEGKHPAVGFNVYLTEHTQQQVTKALILLGRTMSQDKVDRILSKTCTIPKKLVPLTYKGKSGWDSRLASYTGSLDPPDCDQSRHATVPAHVEVRRIMHVVQCPDCHKQSPSQFYKFQYKDLDVKVKCCECLKLTPLKVWKCNCGVLWHTCEVHACAENVEPTLKSKTLSKSSIVNRKNIL